MSLSDPKPGLNTTVAFVVNPLQGGNVHLTHKECLFSESSVCIKIDLRAVRLLSAVYVVFAAFSFSFHLILVLALL